MSADTMAGGGLDRSSARSRRAKRLDLVLQGLLLLALLIGLAFLVALLAQILRLGMGVLSERGLDFLTSGTSSSAVRAGVAQALEGSAYIVGFVVAFAFPIGIATAIYLEEYARDTWLSRLISVNIRNLAGVPSVVYGLLGLSIFVKALQPVTGGRSVISGGITLAILVLPIVIITTMEALRAVPRALREGGYGVGATRWEVTRALVLPYAAPGILTGTVLAISRAIGETAPLILVGALTGFFTTGDQGFSEQLRGKFTALPSIIYGWTKQPSSGFRSLTAAAIIVLLAVTLLANTAAIVLRNRYDKRQTR